MDAAPFEREPEFPQLGINLQVLGPGEPSSMYHREADQEGFLILSGEAVPVIEGGERRLKAWDFVHCPVGANHVIVGAGVEEDTTDPDAVYARFPDHHASPCRDGWLPDPPPANAS